MADSKIVKLPKRKTDEVRSGMNLADYVNQAGIYGGMILGYRASGELVVIPTSSEMITTHIGTLERAKARLMGLDRK